MIGSDPPKASDITDGDASVSTQTGALQYSYPIRVPPGRNGMVPHLALSYLSQAPIYGGIAAGWSLPIPEIREDTSQGRLRTHSPEVEAAQGPTAFDDDRFVRSMAGRWSRSPSQLTRRSCTRRTARRTTPASCGTSG